MLIIGRLLFVMFLVYVIVILFMFFYYVIDNYDMLVKIYYGKCISKNFIIFRYIISYIEIMLNVMEMFVLYLYVIYRKWIWFLVNEFEEWLCSIRVN